MSMQVDCNHYAHHNVPGYEALTRKSELSLEDRNSAICILKFKDVMIEAIEHPDLT